MGWTSRNLREKDGAISEFTFAVDKAETSGKYGKPAEYWQQFRDAIENGTAVKIVKKAKDKSYEAWQIGAKVYRVPNPDVADQANTVLKMAEKRALVAAVLIATNISEYFTQDIEDYVEGVIVETAPVKVEQPAVIKHEIPVPELVKVEPTLIQVAQGEGGEIADWQKGEDGKPYIELELSQLAFHATGLANNKKRTELQDKKYAYIKELMAQKAQE